MASINASTGSGGGVVTSADASGNISIQSNGTNVFTVANNYKVGIGTVSPAVSLDLSANTDAMLLPIGTTAQRPTATNGLIRYNSTTNYPEFYSSSNSAWTSFGSGSGGSSYSTVRQQFTATSGQTTFTVTYLAGQVDVYYNGVKLQAGVEVNTSSGTAVVLAVGATAGALVEVVGLGAVSSVTSNSQVVYQQFTAAANQTTFTVTGGYNAGLVDVFVEGIKLVNGVDVNVSNGSTVVVANTLTSGSMVEVRGITASVNPSSTAMVRQSFTATAGQTSFTVTGGYIPGAVDVYYNGAKLVNGTDVNNSSGTAVVLAIGATVGAVVDVVGINYYTNSGGVTTPVRQSFTATAGQTTFTITGGYSPTFCDVYQNGVKLVNGTDVNVSSGSTVVLASSAAVSDTIDVVAFSAVSYQDAVRKSGDTMTGSLNISGNLAVTGTISDSSGTNRPLVSGTVQNSTSGTSIDFTGIPSWAKRVTVMFNGVSTSGTSYKLVQIGSGSITSTGYVSAGGSISGATGYTVQSSTAGFIIASADASDNVYGSVVINLINGNTWGAYGTLGDVTGTYVNAYTVSGGIALSGTLDRVRITTVNGTDTFDAGSVNIMYE